MKFKDFTRNMIISAFCLMMIIRLVVNLVYYVEPKNELHELETKSLQEVYSIEKYKNSKIVCLNNYDKWDVRLECNFDFYSTDNKNNIFEHYTKELEKKNWKLTKIDNSDDSILYIFKKPEFRGLKFEIFYNENTGNGNYGIYDDPEDEYYWYGIKDEYKSRYRRIPIMFY